MTVVVETEDGSDNVLYGSFRGSADYSIKLHGRGKREIMQTDRMVRSRWVASAPSNIMLFVR